MKITLADIIWTLNGAMLALGLLILGVQPGHILAACVGVPALLVMLAATFAPLIDKPSP